MSGWARCCGALALASSLAAQSEGFEVALRDGTTVIVQRVRGDAVRGFELQGAAGNRLVPASELLAIHGVAASVPDLPAAYLAGGEVLRGPIVGGDAAGQQLELQSPVLGRLTVAVDRLWAVLRDRAVLPAALPLPSGVEEAIFVRAAIGHDVIAGTLHQFGELGVRFQPDGAAAPRWYATGDFVGLVVTAPPPQPPPGGVWLVTRLAEQLNFPAPATDDEGFTATLSGGVPVRVRAGDLACLCFGDGVVFASDLAPQAVEEAGYDGEVVLPWRRDRNVLDGPLVAGGRTHGKGLGVHSRSRLVFTVPKGCDRFWTRIGLDDCALQVGLQPDAVARIVRNGKVVFHADGLRAGQPPRDSGVLAVQAGDLLALEVDFGKGRDLGDRVDWLSPVFLPAGLRRP